MGPKKHRGFANLGQAIHGLATAAHNRWESFGSEGGHHITDRLKGCIHCWGRIVLHPHPSVLTQNTRPPHLHQVRREDRKWPLPFTVGGALAFHRRHSMRA